MSGHIEQLLRQLEQTMKEQQLCSEPAPTAEQLASQAPFACDTLSFGQWLQFVFLPKMRALLASGESLPSAMAVAPAAEVYLNGEHRSVISLLAQLDEAVVSEARRTDHG